MTNVYIPQDYGEVKFVDLCLTKHLSLRWISRMDAKSRPVKKKISIIALPFPLELHASFPTLLWLTSKSSPWLLLIPGHTGAELNVYPWRRWESKRFSNFDKVDLIDVKHRTERMRRICLQVRSVGIFCRLE